MLLCFPCYAEMDGWMEGWKDRWRNGWMRALRALSRCLQRESGMGNLRQFVTHKYNIHTHTNTRTLNQNFQSAFNACRGAQPPRETMVNTAQISPFTSCSPVIPHRLAHKHTRKQEIQLAIYCCGSGVGGKTQSRKRNHLVPSRTTS